MAGSLILEFNKTKKTVYVKLDDGVNAIEHTLGGIFADSVVPYQDSEGNFFYRLVSHDIPVAVFRVDPSKITFRRCNDDRRRRYKDRL